MFIKDIEYCITLFFANQSGELMNTLDFPDFQALNHYVSENSNDGCVVTYSFREIIDGKPDVHMWESEFLWQQFSDKDIQREIEQQLQFLEEAEVFGAELDKRNKEIHYYETFCDSDEKKSHFKDIAYVCPNCLREVEHCQCEYYPYYLVQIDKLILPIIRELNINGYKTTGCCAGHPDKEELLQIYIAFDRDYEFDMPFPAGGRYSKLKHAISYCPPEEMPREEYAAYQQRFIEELTEWAEMLLPVHSELEEI